MKKKFKMEQKEKRDSIKERRKFQITLTKKYKTLLKQI